MNVQLVVVPQTTTTAALTFSWQTGSLGGRRRITAGTCRLNSSAYSPQKRTRPFSTLPALKLCGSASLKIDGGGPTAVAHPSATGGD